MCLFRLAEGDRAWRPTLVVCSEYVKACSGATSGLQSVPFAPMPQPSRLIATKATHQKPTQMPQNDPWARSGRPTRKCSAPCWVQQGFLGTHSKSVPRWQAPRTRRVSTRWSSNQQFSAVILASVRGTVLPRTGRGTNVWSARQPTATSHTTGSARSRSLCQATRRARRMIFYRRVAGYIRGTQKWIAIRDPRHAAPTRRSCRDSP